ncbi:uncharacterized protein K452DRAFT_292059 [Aplosporella prunicola CBS 121167]|uniref:Ketoreductase domain-containing protein n=1 Tax=Aplosporella prunicola CBS 121167 TaxID=1176127 RepID=A0A6A6AYH8_9PEZI|nr:uncharacterized protein K452DRAFT_292059 [Aplosporella prunicola CBS 121167]KAF2136830.1 hypothetical protein K452DRAFT_292059 [Aplosporella prunicola CBS 121167]
MAPRMTLRRLRLPLPLRRLSPASTHWARASSSSSSSTSPRPQDNQNQAQTPPTASKPRTVIVTGAAQGIGKALALHLSLHEHYALAINDIPSNARQAESLVKQINASGGRATLALADVRDRSAVDGMVAQAVRELGPLHGMVANAGVAGVGGVLDLDDNEVRKAFEVNVFGLWNCYAAAAREMIRQGTAGRLVGAASIVAHRPFPHLAPYSASKAAARSLTQSFALSLAKHNITANCYAPGIVDTSMWAGIDAGLGKVENRAPGESIRLYSQQLIAMGRTSRPEDLNGVVAWLLGEGSAYVTGQTVVVDGGVVLT